MPGLIDPPNLPKRVQGTTKTYLFGDPIAKSLSIAFQNACYQARNVPYFHERFESVDTEAFVKLLYRGDCGGSAVTMPHKTAIMGRKEIQEVETQAKLIGASNTLYWREDRATGQRRLVATNTDVAGIRDSIRTQVSEAELAAFQQVPPSDRIGLVVGGGGTTRTSIVTLRMDLGCTGPIYVINRFGHEVDVIVDDFASKGLENVHHLRSPAEVAELLEKQGKRPHYIVNAIPSMAPSSEEELLARQTLTAVLALRSPSSPSSQPQLPAAFLEMCYAPQVWTDVCTLAKNSGWNVVTGEKCMYLQAVAQQILWLGPSPDVDLAEEGRKGSEIEVARRARGEEPL